MNQNQNQPPFRIEEQKKFERQQINEEIIAKRKQELLRRAQIQQQKLM